MTQCFVIETDSESGYVHVYDVSKDYTATVNYSREAGVASVVMGKLSPEFYGKLDAILVTADKISNAQPIEPVVEQAA